MMRGAKESMKMDKRILFVGNTSWSMYNFRLEVMKFLFSKGYSVTVAAPYDNWSKPIEDVGFHYLPLEMDNVGVSPTKDLGLFFRLIKIYRRVKPDFIFHYTIKPNIYGSIAAAVLSIPSVACVTGLGSGFISGKVVSWVIKRLYRFAFKFSKRVWFLNEDDAHFFCNKQIVDKKKATILPGEGVNTTQFSPLHTNKEFDGIVFLYLGRLLKYKGVREFVEAAKLTKQKYPDCKFQILGFLDLTNPSAITEDELKGWVTDGVVEYLGYTDDVREFISLADCVVLPSHYREGVPRSLLEASSMGKPIITSDVTGCRDVVQDGITGLLCKKADTLDLYQKIEVMILSGKEGRDSMGNAGRQNVLNNFDVKFVISEYEAILNSN